MKEEAREEPPEEAGSVQAPRREDRSQNESPSRIPKAVPQLRAGYVKKELVLKRPEHKQAANNCLDIEKQSEKPDLPNTSFDHTQTLL